MSARILLLLAACLPLVGPSALQGPRVVSVENGGLLFTDNQAGVSGTDCGYSLPMGRSTLWFFGDVFMLDPTSPAKRYTGALSNCGLVVPKGQGRAVLGKYRFLTEPRKPVARQLIPLKQGEGESTRLWAFGGWFDKTAGKAYVYYAVVKTTGGGGPFDFKVIGNGLCRIDENDLDHGSFERLPAPSPDGVWWETARGPIFGAAVVEGPGSTRDLYVVGVENRQGRKVGKMAMVPKAKIGDLRAYSYYVGGSIDSMWSRSPASAGDVVGLTDFPSELSISYNDYLHGYLAAHSVGISDRIRLCLAPDPWGPYHTIGEIGAPKRALSKAFCYAGKEHPELQEAGGKIIYVTYVDSERYWLQLLKVTLDRGAAQ